MNEITLLPGQRSGVVRAPSSKSQAHRLLICAALGESACTVNCGEKSKDIEATAKCLAALCADIKELFSGIYRVFPARKSGGAVLPCGESGSTLRFLLPVCGALGKSAVFKMEGRLPERPLYPFDELLCARGMSIEKCGDELRVSGRLQSGVFEIAGDVSSQFISGLLFALPLLDGDSVIRITGKTESRAYIELTESALKSADIRFEKSENEYTVFGNQKYALPDGAGAEGDYSNGALFLCMGALSESGIRVVNLPEASLQGDKKIVDILRRFGADVSVRRNEITVRKGNLCGCEIDASDIPDLVPVCAVTATAAEGETRIYNAARLRLKESDRLSATAELITNLGGSVTELPDGLIIRGGGLRGGKISSYNDHRIAMSAAVAACICTEPVTISNPNCTDKSFPLFWERFEALERKT